MCGIPQSSRMIVIVSARFCHASVSAFEALSLSGDAHASDRSAAASRACLIVGRGGSAKGYGGWGVFEVQDAGSAVGWPEPGAIARDPDFISPIGALVKSIS